MNCFKHEVLVCVVRSVGSDENKDRMKRLELRFSPWLSFAGSNMHCRPPCSLKRLAAYPFNKDSAFVIASLRICCNPEIVITTICSNYEHDIKLHR